MKKQKDGRYRGKITVGHDADGRPVVKYASSRTQRGLREELERIRRKHIADTCDNVVWLDAIRERRAAR